LIRVLIIEDNLQQAEIIKQFMVSADIEAAFVTDSTNALDEIHNFRPDVIILDIMMPKMDGLTILKKIRDNSDWEHIKVIIYTAKNFEVDRRKAIHLGANLFLPKPTRGYQIVEHVKSLAGVVAV
jgi:DNA-binding response OmpR family regulator